MSDPTFSREYPGYRLVETRRGDTLQRVAARELGNAERWYELVFINQLRPPYLTDDSTAAGPGVLVTGSSLSVPATVDFVPSHIDPRAVFGADVRLTRGELTAASGDLKLIEGAPNLSQAIRHVVATDLGELVWHPSYGCGVRRLLGRRSDPVSQRLAGSLVRRAVVADDRVQSAELLALDVSGDAVRATVRAAAVTGARVEVDT